MSISYDYITQPIKVLANPVVQPKGLWPGLWSTDDIHPGVMAFKELSTGNTLYVPNSLWQNICLVYTLGSIIPETQHTVTEAERAALWGQESVSTRLNPDAFGLGLVQVHSPSQALVDELVYAASKRAVNYDLNHQKGPLLAVVQEFGWLLDLTRWKGQLFCFIFDVLIPDRFGLELERPSEDVLRVRVYNYTTGVSTDWEAFLSFGLSGLRMTGRNLPQQLLPLASHWPSISQLELEINGDTTILWSASDEYPTVDSWLNSEIKRQHDEWQEEVDSPVPDSPTVPDLPISPDPPDWIPDWDDVPQYPAASGSPEPREFPRYTRNYQSLANEGLLGPSLYWWAAGDSNDAAWAEGLKSATSLQLHPPFDRPRESNLLCGSWFKLTEKSEGVGQKYYYYDGVILAQKLAGGSKAYQFAWSSAILDRLPEGGYADDYVFSTGAGEHYIQLNADFEMLTAANEVGGRVRIGLPANTCILVERSEEDGLWYPVWRPPIFAPDANQPGGISPTQSLTLGKVICIKGGGRRLVFPPSIHAHLLALELKRFDEESEALARNASTEAGGKTNDPEDLDADPMLKKFLFIILVAVVLMMLFRNGDVRLVLPGRDRSDKRIDSGSAPSLSGTNQSTGSESGARFTPRSTPLAAEGVIYE